MGPKADDGILLPMEEWIDDIAIIGACTVLLAGQWGGAYSVSGFLAAVTLVCLHRVMCRPWRAIPLAVFLAVAAVAPALCLFLPVATYQCLHERPWALRFVWLVPLAAVTLQGLLPVQALWAVAVMGAFAALLAVRDVRQRSERDGLRFAYDDLRERSLALREERDQALRAASGESAEETREEEVFSDLTKREMAVARLVAQGLDNREIASTLFLSEGTVRNHISVILSKMELSNRTQIAVAYYRGA